MIYKAVEVIWIFLADWRTDGTGNEGTIRGPRGPKNISDNCAKLSARDWKCTIFSILSKKNIQTESNFWKAKFETGAFLKLNDVAYLLLANLNNVFLQLAFTHNTLMLKFPLPFLSLKWPFCPFLESYKPNILSEAQRIQGIESILSKSFI